MSHHIEKLEIEGARELAKKGNFPQLDADIITIDKINEIIEVINSLTQKL